jgi:hypothetical protein
MMISLLIDYHPSLAAASSTLANASSSAKDALDAANTLWVTFYNGSGIFGRVARFCIGIAFVFLMIKVYKLYDEYKQDLDHLKVVQSMIFPLVCIIMLSQSGAPAKGFTYGIRTLTQGFGIEIMSNISTDMVLDSSKSNDSALTSSAVYKEYQLALSKCRSQKDPTQCAQLETSKVQQRINAGLVTDPTVKDYIAKQADSFQQNAAAQSGAGNGDWLSEGLSGALDGIITAVLNAVTIIFYWAIELAAMLSFYLFPVALTMGVMEGKAVSDWFAQFWALCNAKICYAIVLALIAQVTASLPPVLFVVPLIAAFFAPFATFIFAKGSMIAVAEGLANAPGQAAKAGIGKANGMRKEHNAKVKAARQHAEMTSSRS